MKGRLGVLLLLLLGIIHFIQCRVPQSKDAQMRGILVQGGVASNSSRDDRRGLQGLSKGRRRLLNVDPQPSAPRESRILSEQKSSIKQIEGSPMPIDLDSPNDTACRANINGSYGSVQGDRVPIFFFYQVEAVPGTTESRMNGVILDYIAVALVDSLIPRLFDECSSSTETTTWDPIIQRSGRYVGLSSNPADFVLRGFECTEEASEPCFVVSGSMTAFTKEMEPELVQAELRVEILRIMSGGGISATIAQVNEISLLDDALNLATLPSTIAPTPQLALSPTTLLPETLVPTRAPSGSPTMAQPTLLPTTSPSTASPTSSPSTSPPTSSPTTMDPSSASPTSPATSDTDVPSMPATIENLTPSPSSTDGAELESLAPTGGSPESNSTLPPTALETQSQTINYAYREHESAFEKVPIWCWIIIGIAVCGCCTYAADPDDDDEDDAGVNENLKDLNEQERLTLANGFEEIQGPSHESEMFSAKEYFRKLYRQ